MITLHDIEKLLTILGLIVGAILALPFAGLLVVVFSKWFADKMEKLNHIK